MLVLSSIRQKEVIWATKSFSFLIWCHHYSLYSVRLSYSQGTQGNRYTISQTHIHWCLKFSTLKSVKWSECATRKGQIAQEYNWTQHCIIIKAEEGPYMPPLCLSNEEGNMGFTDHRKMHWLITRWCDIISARIVPLKCQKD